MIRSCRSQLYKKLQIDKLFSIQNLIERFERNSKSVMHSTFRPPTQLPFRVIVFGIFLLSSHLMAQELTPRRWTHMPIDLNIGGVAYAYTKADIYLNPVLQLEDLELNMNTVAARYIRTFEFLGHSSRFELGQKYQDGTWDGILKGEHATAHRSGWADTTLRISSILYGAPPLKGKEFKKYRQSVANCETIVGAALIVDLPTGEYSNQYLLNLGNNRFKFRPQLGITHRRGHWTFEASGSAWIFTDNNDFWQGTQREQDPFYTVQTHLIYTFRPGFWTSASVGYGIGGQNTIDGKVKDDRGENLVWALAGGYSFTAKTGIKLAYVNTLTQTNTGFDSDNVLIGFSMVW